ncbi:selenocysteine-specific elongation factor [Georgenia soli]|uniref:Selenocysteine-specific elongation factor n=1 Tax=Georgenia soli TaxID=638953 RepID=A0A2A9EPC2_9MICO|nr:selenocysteine-specific translation elongation factor [Georgenia soli]PFG40456.1 selenocysteine-specific elongation factor [Georgenia soli]
MHVVATAGHVDHGKSTLVRALTGTDPDRLPEEHRRGLTIELGFCWTALPGAGDVAFVDVPGHERFVPTMLAGVGPVPVALLVVAADDPWMPQTAEHLAALDGLGVSRGVVAVTRADLADPGPAAARAREQVDRTSLRGARVVPVSAVTGAGLPELTAALAEVLAQVPPPEREADVRLWVDRRFTVRGTGTVVTGTLPAGRVAPGDRLTHDGGTVRVRAVQSLGRAVPEAVGVARVALGLAGDDEGLERGSVLVTPDAWHVTDVVDVRLRRVGDAATHHPLPPLPLAETSTPPRDVISSPTPESSAAPPQRPLLHVGAASVEVHHRPLGGELARLRLRRPLPLRIGDRALLRDPGSRALWGVVVLDPAPPALTRRGAGARRAQALADADGAPRLPRELARRGGVADLALLRRIGVPTSGAAEHGVVDAGLVMSTERAERARADAARLVGEHDAAHPLDPGVPPGALAARLGVPERLLRAALRPPLTLRNGRVTLAGRGDGLPAALAAALETLDAELADAPFAAPTADRLRELRLDERALAAAARAGRLLRPAPGIVLPSDAAGRAAAWLAELPQPFTTSQARVRLGTSRRVVLPLLDHLDRQGLTRRLPDDRREVTPAARRG